ncbi:uncharacterized protein LACBIDRAFT_312552 [Laccaria bicolor S238N-H82]|uniref:Predicted protein n=1 Tax=Laccaria bicolor (strain S238N-H82 / ATCC MYA-4686) TaxID=486041 RepID=B0DWD2_LACBS|nr:uncharacterized protein LACBIDRAFT_312549 [Laccaria bicolor S238N-H82]XP_001888287.1 uncharacterized protein LACBIDRAFT_312552 [Laccaria bicolor S238N-H82]EDR01066.1 predicted protein [Laccaria bicolor S238N-H82]EDR01068.1 predicted protein [Laccaria bicolor S238N-H82]|eukprot:XP_001888285.1 predicted protein [Laccaria bicolor S238N-H82]
MRVSLFKNPLTFQGPIFPHTPPLRHESLHPHDDLDSIGHPSTQSLPRTCVWYNMSISGLMFATVDSTGRLPDGTMLLTIIDDDGEKVTLPACGVTQVS